MMDTSLFDYHLPEDRIAQAPAARRDASRLLVVRRREQTVEHAHFSDLGSFLPQGTQLIRNNVAVLKARLRGTRDTGGAVECLLLQPAADPAEWWCFLKPGRKLPVGASFSIPSGGRATVAERNESGEARVHFDLPEGMSVIGLSNAMGEVPLPPYIRRIQEAASATVDEERYQTTYADMREQAAVAAPTAGLHFTPELDNELVTQGHSFHHLTLHVGIGTFKPIQVENLEDHVMHREFYRIAADTLHALTDKSHPRLCVGTTSLRASEDCLRKGGTPNAGGAFEDWAQLFIRPPAQFHIDHLITNFHLPRSTLLCLVSAFLTPGSMDGINWLKELYRCAIERHYRFYSYGDAMLIL